MGLSSAHYPYLLPNRCLDGSKIKNRIIEQNNLKKDAIIIFSRDNGGLGVSGGIGHADSGPLRRSKYDIWEGGHMMPLVIRNDGIFPAKKERKKMLASMMCMLQIAQC